MFKMPLLRASSVPDLVLTPSPLFAPSTSWLQTMKFRIYLVHSRPKFDPEIKSPCPWSVTPPLETLKIKTCWISAYPKKSLSLKDPTAKAFPGVQSIDVQSYVIQQAGIIHSGIQCGMLGVRRGLPFCRQGSSSWRHRSGGELLRVNLESIGYLKNYNVGGRKERV